VLRLFRFPRAPLAASEIFPGSDSVFLYGVGNDFAEHRRKLKSMAAITRSNY